MTIVTLVDPSVIGLVDLKNSNPGGSIAQNSKKDNNLVDHLATVPVSYQSIIQYSDKNNIPGGLFGNHPS